MFTLVVYRRLPRLPAQFFSTQLHFGEPDNKINNTSASTAEDGNPTLSTSANSNPQLDGQVVDPAENLRPLEKQYQKSSTSPILSTKHLLTTSWKRKLNYGAKYNGLRVGHLWAAQLKLLTPGKAINAQMDINHVFTKYRFNRFQRICKLLQIGLK